MVHAGEVAIDVRGGADPDEQRRPGLVGVTRIRTLSIRPGEYSQPTPADPSSVDTVANADPEVEKSWTSVVA